MILHFSNKILESFPLSFSASAFVNRQNKFSTMKGIRPMKLGFIQKQEGEFVSPVTPVNKGNSQQKSPQDFTSHPWRGKGNWVCPAWKREVFRVT